MAEGGVLTEMLPDHFHSLHLQPLQLLRTWTVSENAVPPTWFYLVRHSPPSSRTHRTNSDGNKTLGLLAGGMKVSHGQSKRATLSNTLLKTLTDRGWSGDGTRLKYYSNIVRIQNDDFLPDLLWLFPRTIWIETGYKGQRTVSGRLLWAKDKFLHVDINN